MKQTITLAGVPRSIVLDGWWLDAPVGSAAPPTPPDAAGTRSGGGRMPFVAGLLVLIGLADLLFWGHGPGVSAALFAAAVFGVATGGMRPRRALIRPVVLLGAGAAPVVDHVQALSLAFLGAALVAALIWARHPGARPGALIGAALAFVMRLPARWLAPLRPRRIGGRARGLLLQQGHFRPAPALRHQIRNWAFPLGGTLVFTALLMDANPLLARLFTLDLDLWATVQRGLFWAGTGLLVAPFLQPDLALEDAPHLPAVRRVPDLGINAGSVLRALVLFNLLIGLQMVADASILIGGADLPAGMSYADYAHRGAYPLLATAMLAGSFALAARPFLAEHRAIGPLLLLWLGQNVVLCAAAILRLEVYIDAYGLTYLRIHALIWMMLVAAGLVLTAFQVLRGRDTVWLFLRAAALGLVTLYLCSFVNFAQIIAAQNLRRERPDMGYVCALGQMAAGALAEARTLRPALIAPDGHSCLAMVAPEMTSWQEWGFRRASVADKVAATARPEQIG